MPPSGIGCGGNDNARHSNAVSAMVLGDIPCSPGQTGSIGAAAEERTGGMLHDGIDDAAQNKESDGRAGRRISAGRAGRSGQYLLRRAEKRRETGAWNGKTERHCGGIAEGENQPGYITMAMSENVAAETLAAFAQPHIEEGSTISSDAYSSYLKAFSAGKYRHEPKRLTNPIRIICSGCTRLCQTQRLL